MQDDSPTQQKKTGKCVALAVLSIMLTAGCTSFPRLPASLENDVALLSQAKTLTDAEAVDILRDSLVETEHVISWGKDDYGMLYAVEDMWLTSLDMKHFEGELIRHESLGSYFYRVETNHFTCSMDEIVSINMHFCGLQIRVKDKALKNAANGEPLGYCQSANGMALNGRYLHISQTPFLLIHMSRLEGKNAEERKRLVYSIMAAFSRMMPSTRNLLGGGR